MVNRGGPVFSPAVSIIIGIVALLIFVCLGVGVFIYSDYKNKQILFVDNQNIILDNVTKKYVEDAKTAYCPFHIRCIIIGTGLCIMASIPIIVFALLIITNLKTVGKGLTGFSMPENTLNFLYEV